jgi:hypothetical protein
MKTSVFYIGILSLLHAALCAPSLEAQASASAMRHWEFLTSLEGMTNRLNLFWKEKAPWRGESGSFASALQDLAEGSHP